MRTQQWIMLVSELRIALEVGLEWSRKVEPATKVKRTLEEAWALGKCQP
ncbi:hypothetical protein PSA5_00180 [Pseudomonas syringae pv. actinidiae]|nr:hypothetical protein PSA5_00180 [Pseudomonas syringae pv. actinidiae]